MLYRIAFILAATVAALGWCAGTGHAEEPAPHVEIGTAVRAYGGGHTVPPPPPELPHTGPDPVLWAEGAGGALLVAVGATLARVRVVRNA